MCERILDLHCRTVPKENEKGEKRHFVRQMSLDPGWAIYNSTDFMGVTSSFVPSLSYH